MFDCDGGAATCMATATSTAATAANDGAVWVAMICGCACTTVNTYATSIVNMVSMVCGVYVGLLVGADKRRIIVL